MNSVKVSVVIALATSVALLAGCGGFGRKKEEQATLPPEQILSGNAILAPQQTVLESRNISSGALSAPQGSMTMPEPTLESTSALTENPTDKDIQQALKNAGIYSGPIDGNIGPKSKKAIRMFQEQNGMTADGKVGPKTWRKLSAYLNSAPVSTADRLPSGEEAGTNEISN